jgi:uncharacterized cupin superfamily protein
MPTAPVVNISDLELQPRPAEFAPTESPARERFDARMAQIGRVIGARKLGYNLTAVPPGKVAFPFHSHRVNEEMFFVLQGHGEIRIGDAVHAIRAGDVIACPPGGAEAAHQIRNTGDQELRYLAVSTRETPDVVAYPDSGKFGVYGEFGMGAAGTPERFVYIGRESVAADYWDGEGAV